MADNHFSYETRDEGRGEQPALDPEYGASLARPLMTATNVAGACVSVALVAGIGFWGYDLMVRDVSGVPVVRAAATEMRIRPENPGGQLAQHQGLSVNEIAANGQAAGPVDQVVLAPPPVTLWVEDQPVVSPDSPPAAKTAPLGAAASPFGTEQSDIDTLVQKLVEEAALRDDTDGSETSQLRPAVQTGDNLAIAQPAVLVEIQDAVKIDAPGVRQSARPRLRPLGAGALIQPAAYTPEVTAEIDASAIPSGTRLAQLGAFDSAEVARSEWQRMQGLFGEMLQNKSRVVQEAQSGGRTFYRLRAMGFVDLNDTRRFCSAVKAEGVDCIPVQVK